MRRVRALGIVFGLSVTVGCSALFGTSDGSAKRQTDEEERVSSPPHLERVEIVEVVETRWQAVADRCRSEETLDPEAQGRLMTLRAGEEIYRIFLAAGRAIHCEENDMARRSETEAELDPELGASLEAARTDLAARLSTDLRKIEVTRAERVRWRDSSAGCPESDRMYMQVITEGARFLLAVAGREYAYHQVGSAAPIYCESPSKIEPLPGLEIR